MDLSEREREFHLLANLLNMTFKSGFIKPEVVIREMVKLTTADPVEVMQAFEREWEAKGNNEQS